MPFTFTTPERDAVAATHINQYAKLEVQGPGGAWFDVSADLGYPDWFTSAQISDSIDANTITFQATLLRGTKVDPTDADEEGEALSLAPFREDSTINRDDLNVYAPMLDLVRMWRVSVAVMEDGDTPVYKEIGKGYIDSIDVDDLSPTITITGRGEEAPILDCEILEIKTYSPGDSDDVEDVIQALLNDNLLNPPTLYAPTASAFVINEYEQDFGNLMNAIQGVASLVGAIVRYFYDSAGVNRLTLFFPNRDAEPGDEDWEIGPEEYLRLPLNRTDITGVRNFIPIRYNDNVTMGVAVVTSPSTFTSASITRYGRRSLPIDLSPDTQIMTEAQAQALADAIRSDLEYPHLQQRFVTYGFWFVQLCDYGKLLPNDVHYDNAQYGGVTAYSHEIAQGVIRTAVDLGALPSGGYKRWVPIGRFPPKGPIQPPGGPIYDPILPPFNPSPPGPPGGEGGGGSGSITGAVTILFTPDVAGNNGFASTGTPYSPPVCVSALSGLADTDYQMGLCDVDDTADVYALSSQQNGSAVATVWTLEVTGYRMAHCYGVTLVQDFDSANNIQHLSLNDRFADPIHTAAAFDSQTNIKSLYPAQDHMDFWVRCFLKNMIAVPIAQSSRSSAWFGTQHHLDGFGVYLNSDDDNKLYIYRSAPDVDTGDVLTALTVEVLPTDIVEAIWHWELSNATSINSGQAMRYDYTLTMYVRINGGLPDSRVFTGRVRQARVQNNSANPLTPFALNMPHNYSVVGTPPTDLQVHGWEFVPSSDSTDPFNVVP